MRVIGRFSNSDEKCKVRSWFKNVIYGPYLHWICILVGVVGGSWTADEDEVNGELRIYYRLNPKIAYPWCPRAFGKFHLFIICSYLIYLYFWIPCL